MQFLTVGFTESCRVWDVSANIDKCNSSASSNVEVCALAGDSITYDTKITSTIISDSSIIVTGTIDFGSITGTTTPYTFTINGVSPLLITGIPTVITNRYFDFVALYNKLVCDSNDGTIIKFDIRGTEYFAFKRTPETICELATCKCNAKMDLCELDNPNVPLSGNIVQYSTGTIGSVTEGIVKCEGDQIYSSTYAVCDMNDKSDCSSQLCSREAKTTLTVKCAIPDVDIVVERYKYITNNWCASKEGELVKACTGVEGEGDCNPCAPLIKYTVKLDNEPKDTICNIVEVTPKFEGCTLVNDLRDFELILYQDNVQLGSYTFTTNSLETHIFDDLVLQSGKNLTAEIKWKSLQQFIAECSTQNITDVSTGHIGKTIVPEPNVVVLNEVVLQDSLTATKDGAPFNAVGVLTEDCNSNNSDCQGFIINKTTLTVSDGTDTISYPCNTAMEFVTKLFSTGVTNLDTLVNNNGKQYNRLVSTYYVNYGSADTITNNFKLTMRPKMVNSQPVINLCTGKPATSSTSYSKVSYNFKELAELPFIEDDLVVKSTEVDAIGSSDIVEPIVEPIVERIVEDIIEPIIEAIVPTPTVKVTPKRIPTRVIKSNDVSVTPKVLVTTPIVNTILPTPIVNPVSKPTSQQNPISTIKTTSSTIPDEPKITPTIKSDPIVNSTIKLNRNTNLLRKKVPKGKSNQ